MKHKKNGKPMWNVHVEQFFLANNTDEDHQVPTLLSLIGGKTCTLLRDRLTPEKPELAGDCHNHSATLKS